MPRRRNLSLWFGAFTIWWTWDSGLEGGQGRVSRGPTAVVAYLGARGGSVGGLVGALCLTTEHLHWQAEVRSVAEGRRACVLALCSMYVSRAVSQIRGWI